MPAGKRKSKDDGVASVLSGTYVFANGDKYDGEYRQLDDGTLERSGSGNHTTSDGTSYTGNWVTDKMNGKGKITFPSEATYEGDFVNNQMHGKGVYTWPNGSYYTGEFTENKMEGTGTFTDTDGQVWSGTFRYKAAPGLRFQLNL